MPKQSRGFWVCIYCERAFDQYQEAEYHERIVHPPPSAAAAAVQRSPPKRMAVSEPLPPNWGGGQQQYDTSGASSSQHYPHPQQQSHHHPSSLPPPHGMAPREDRRRSAGPPHKPVPMQRYLPIMASQEASSLSSGDTLACRSYELFEVTDLFGDSGPVAGQVGLRCAFCAETSDTTSSYIFPADTRSVGDSLRHAGMEHLAACRHFPEEYQRQIQDALHRRKQLKKEGATGTAVHEDDANRRILVDYCAKKCMQAGVVDRSPSGMVFADTEQQMALLPPPHRYAAVPVPYPGMQQHAISQMTSKRGGTDSTSMEPARYPPIQPSPPTHHMQHEYNAMQNEYPFFYEENRWVCKFCAHVPQPYRDPQFFWASTVNNLPPGNFIDYHLSICREYQKAVMYEQQYGTYRGDPRMDPRSAARGMGSPAFGQPPWDPQQPMAMAPTTPRGGATSHDYASPHGQVSSPYNAPSYATGSAGEMGPPMMHQQQQPPMRPPEVSEEVARAIEYLQKHDSSMYDNDGNLVPEELRLVLEEDRLLLTEYFFYLMKQLRLVRFSEADRRTRGGKREKIQVGYGGLQCVHCVDIPNTRKFFWSNVDRLANSFAEIPSHVLKCRRCPQPTKDALLQLKQCHAEQMTRLPRGSQKVFFRRMWRRLHDADPQQSEETGADPYTTSVPPSAMMSDYSSSMTGAPHMRPPPVNTNVESAQYPHQQYPMRQNSSDTSPAGTSGSDESIYFLQRPSKEGAKALAASSIQPGPPSPNSRVLLAIPEDKEWLSDIDCFIRRQLEVFCATEDDVELASEDRKFPVKVGQVGIRCIHCAMSQSGMGAKGQAVAFPFSVSGIYETAREFHRLHLESCVNLPLSAKSKLESLKGSSSLSSVLRKYFVLAAKALGLQDSIHGIRAGAEAVPIGSQAAFAFTEASVLDEMKVSRSSAMRHSPAPGSESRKRKSEQKQTEQESKRPALALSPSYYATAPVDGGESKDRGQEPAPYFFGPAVTEDAGESKVSPSAAPAPHSDDVRQVDETKARDDDEESRKGAETGEKASV